jgi:hypothetical protein
MSDSLNYSMNNAILKSEKLINRKNYLKKPLKKPNLMQKNNNSEFVIMKESI